MPILKKIGINLFYSVLFLLSFAFAFLLIWVFPMNPRGDDGEQENKKESETDQGASDKSDDKQIPEVNYREKRYFWESIVPPNTRRTKKYALVLADLPIENSPRSPFSKYFDHDDQIICIIRTSFGILTDEGSLILVVDPCRFEFVRTVLNE